MKYQYPLPKNIEIKITSPTGEYAHENFPESMYAVDFLSRCGDSCSFSERGRCMEDQE